MQSGLLCHLFVLRFIVIRLLVSFKSFLLNCFLSLLTFEDGIFIFSNALHWCSRDAEFIFSDAPAPCILLPIWSACLGFLCVSPCLLRFPTFSLCLGPSVSQSLQSVKSGVICLDLCRNSFTCGSQSEMRPGWTEALCA